MAAPPEAVITLKSEGHGEGRRERRAGPLNGSCGLPGQTRQPPRAPSRGSRASACHVHTNERGSASEAVRGGRGGAENGQHLARSSLESSCRAAATTQVAPAAETGAGRAVCATVFEDPYLRATLYLQIQHNPKYAISWALTSQLSF